MMRDDRAGTKSYMFLAGIVSYGKDVCSGNNDPTVYTKVSSYLEWIANNMRI